MSQNISVNCRDTGKCVITPVRNITKLQEQTIKALCFLQLACISSEDKEQTKEFLNVLDTAIQKAKVIYGENDSESIIDQY